MYIKSKNRTISDNDLVKVRCIIKNELSDDDEKDIEVLPELTFTHGYTNELTTDIPPIIRNNLDKIIDRYSTINVQLGEEDIEILKLSDVKLGTYLQINVIDVMMFDYKWNLSEDEKMAISQILKIRGNYKAGLKSWSDAFKNYHKAVKYLKGSVCLTSTHSSHESALTLWISCLNNAAISCLKLSSGYLLCIKYCDYILSIDESNTKALYRKAKALLELKNYEPALDCIDKCLSLEMDEQARKEILNIRMICYNKLKAQEQKDKLLCQDIFDKMGDIAKKTPNDNKSTIPYDIENWDNRMADKMISITEELEAFGEEMPPRIIVNHRGGETYSVIEEDDFE